jgi:hypothetical protein
MADGRIGRCASWVFLEKECVVLIGEQGLQQ